MSLTIKILINLLISFILSFSQTMAQGTTITIIHVNDTHSHLDAIGPKDVNLNGTLGGLCKAATVIGTIQATEQNVLFLHAGDAFVGDFFFNTYFGIPELQILKQLNCDAMAVGNHEFDLGPEILQMALDTAFVNGSFPLLSANLDLTGFPSLSNRISPSIIKNVNGIKIGIFGMTIPDPSINSAPVIVMDNVFEIAQIKALELKASGADVVICLSHLGFMYDREVASNLTGIDFIIGGHDHLLFNQPVVIMNPENKPVRIMQAGESYKYVGKLKFTFNNNNIIFNNYEIINVDENVPPVSEIQSVVNSLKDGIVSLYGDVYHTAVGSAVNDIEKTAASEEPFKDTPLGNLVTDAFRHKTGTDIAITANGLMSEKIYSGPIVGADVFRAVSYGFDVQTGLGFKLATFSIKGSELLKGLEIGVSQIEYSDDYLLQVSGMKYKYSPKKPVSHRIVNGSVKINGTPLVPNRVYTVTVDEGLAGLLIKFGLNVTNLTILDDFEYLVLQNFIGTLQTVNYSPEGRVRDLSIHNNGDNVDNGLNKTAPCKFELFGNYPNPFNPVTVIQFSIPVDGKVNLDIYDITGRLVNSLVNDFKKAGKHSVTFNGSALSSGIYFYRIVSGNFTQTKKMILVK